MATRRTSETAVIAAAWTAAMVPPPILMIQYLDWPEPLLPFYRDAFAALDSLAQSAYGCYSPP